MGIFHRLRGSDDEPQLSPALKARLDALDERNRLQEKGLKELELDWQEWYDKFRLLFMRLSKRIKDAANVEENSHNGAQSSEDASRPRATAYDRPAPLADRASPVRRNY